MEAPKKNKLGFVIEEKPQKGKKPTKPEAPIEVVPDSPPPETLGMADEKLWETYSIRAEWPIDKKIELLIFLWNFEALQISDILGVPVEQAEKAIKVLEDSWRTLGKRLSPEEKELARGRQIAELERLKSQLEEAYILHKDPKYLTQKASVLERLGKLRGIDAEKTPVAAGLTDGQTLQERLDGLSSEKSRELLERLKGKPQED